MFRILFLLTLLILSMTTYASNDYEQSFIKGKVIDSLTKEPLSYATVSASKNNVIIYGIITDEKGEFELKLTSGKYLIKVEFLTYQPYEKAININGTLDLGTIELSQTIETLDDVVVQYEKSNVALKIDKKVFNVGKDLLSLNGSLQQVLANVPSVSVDIDGTVSLRGNPNVSILINGKPSVLAINNNLDQIPAEQIDRIEVITNPSSRYQAAGTAGIINVILKTNKLAGLNGTLTISNAVRANTNVNASINYKVNKLNLFSTLGYRFVDNRITEKVLQNSLIENNPIVLNRQTQEYRNSKVGSIYIGFDYFLSEASTLTASYYKFLIKRNNHLRFDFNYYNNLQIIDSTIIRNEKYYEPMDHNQLEVNYTKNFKKEGKKLIIDFQYDFWNDDENEDFSTQTVFQEIQEPIISRTRDIENSKDYLLQLDFINPFNKTSTFETGFRGETRVISSDYKAEILQDNQWEIFDNINNKMDYREQILGVYALYANKSKKISYQLGLRAEYTHINISDRKDQFGSVKNYTRFFPTVHLNYPFSDTNSMLLSYSRRINRPSFWHLNPFSTLSGGLNSVIQGNPNLDPSYTNSLELSFLTKLGKLQLNPSIYYQRTTDPFQFFTQRNERDILVSTTINIDKEIRYGMEFSMTYRPYQWWQISGDFNYFAFQQSGMYQNFNFDFSNNTWTSRVNTQVKLPKQFTLQANYSYEAKNENAQTVTKPYYYLDLGLNKPIFKNRGALTFNVRNILNSRQRKILRTGENFSYQSNRQNIGPLYSLTFSYRFNQMENTQTRRPGSSNR